MSSRRSLLLAVALAAAVLAPSGGASAQGHGRGGFGPNWNMPHGQDRPMEIQARVLPIRALISIVQSQRGGEFRNVVGGLQDGGGRPFYVFRWRYPNGEEENLRVDATSGQVF